jgi:predicted transcriptional regulator
MQKMTAKKLIARKIIDQVHIYYSLVEESAVRNSNVKELITKFFNGSYSSLALHALGNTPSDENIDELVKLVNNFKKNKK